MDKHVWPIVLLDKTKTFCIVKPLHCTFCHFLLQISQWDFFVVQHPIARKRKNAQPKWI